MVRAVRAVLTGRLTVSGFDLAWFSSLSSKRLCVFGLYCVIYTVFRKKTSTFVFLHNSLKFVLKLVTFFLKKIANEILILTA